MALGLAYIRAGQTDLAVGEFGTAKRKNPLDPAAYLEEAKLWLSRGELSLCQSEVVAGLKAAPKSRRKSRARLSSLDKLSPRMREWALEMVRKAVRERFFEIVNQRPGPDDAAGEPDVPDDGQGTEEQGGQA